MMRSELLWCVRPGKTAAEVLFLNNVKGDGWEGPFSLELPIQGLLDFDLRPLPRKVAISEGPPSEKGKEEAVPSGSEERAVSSGRMKVEPKPLTLDPYLTGERGAGLSDVMASARKEPPRKPWTDLTSIYELGELVTFYDRYQGAWRWWRAWVEKVILPTELQYRDGMVDVLYQICPHPGENVGNERLIREEYKLRDYQEGKRATFSNTLQPQS